MKKNLLLLSVFLVVLTLSHVFASGATSVRVPLGSQTPKITTEKKVIRGLVIMNNYFAKDEKNLYVINDDKTGWKLLSGADYDTFRVILGRFAQDKNTIFSLGEPLKNVDRESFVVISGTYGYASDDSTVYGPQGIIEDANPETFKLYTGRYGADAGHVYYMGKLIDADSSTFRVIDGGSYALDEQKVFHNGRILPGIPVEGFTVKGERAFSSNGYVFFEGRVEKGDPLPEYQEPPTPPEESSDIVGGDIIARLFPSEGILTPYKTFIMIEGPFLLFLGCIVLAFFSALFVFFAERNDETASWMKTFFKTLIALLVGGALFWLATYWLSLGISASLGFFIGIIAFLSLSDLGGKMKTLFVTLLSFIALGLFVSIAVIIVRTTVSTPNILMEFIAKETFQVITLLAGIGIFMGFWLLKTQLKTSAAGAVSGALIATIFSLLILIFVYWLGPLSTAMATLLFSLLFGAFVWVLSFRLNQTLLLTSIRVLRIMILLGMLCFIVVWFIV